MRADDDYRDLNADERAAWRAYWREVLGAAVDHAGAMLALCGAFTVVTEVVLVPDVLTRAAGIGALAGAVRGHLAASR